VDLGAWDEGPPAHVEASRRTPSDADGARSAIETVVLARPGVLDPDATDAWFDQLVAEAPSRLLRLQAVLRVSTHEPRVCVRGSRSVMRSQLECGAAAVPSEVSRHDGSVVVLIGRELDERTLREEFWSIEEAR